MVPVTLSVGNIRKTRKKQSHQQKTISVQINLRAKELILSKQSDIDIKAIISLSITDGPCDPDLKTLYRIFLKGLRNKES